MHDRDLLYWADGRAPAGSDQVSSDPDPDTGAMRVFTPIAFERWAHGKYKQPSEKIGPKLMQGYKAVFLQVQDSWPSAVDRAWEHDVVVLFFLKTTGG